jgi:hypothetical protein
MIFVCKMVLRPRIPEIFLCMILALLLLSATVHYPALIMKGQAKSYIAWAKQKNLSSSISTTNNTKGIPTAESVYKSESMTLPTSVGSFVLLIANEAHERWQTKNTICDTVLANTGQITKQETIP